MRSLLSEGGIVVGVDPGQFTGIVVLRVPPSLDLNQVTWMTSGVVTRGEGKLLTEAELDARFSERVGEFLMKLDIAHVAMEEPADASVGWRGQHKQQAGTAFRLGAYYGLALAAIGRHPSHKVIASYPVTNYGKRVGWMRGQKRERILTIIDQTLRAIRAPVGELSEHERMAMGVVMHHLEVIAQERMARKVEAVKARAVAEQKAAQKATRKAARPARGVRVATDAR